jgi:tetratricopeptide (TPR) repeat protein
MTLETIHNQINHAASLFLNAQRQFEGIASNNINTNSSVKQEIIHQATQSLTIYRSVYSFIQRSRDKRKNRSINENSRRINLELRMAFVLRFLAVVSAHHVDKEQERESHVQTAIRYHDDAVSLLVGVFDEKQDADNTDGESDKDSDDEDGVLFTLSAPDESTLVFVHPTENQRVRAIAASLNALASLHAVLEDDRSAMDSYREALEILRAATEESESKHSEDVECDLADTLMNVGSFHLRRDELEAARNAYSTVFALHTAGESKSISLPRLNSKGSREYSSQASMALNNLGVVYERQGQLGEAYECYNRVRLGREEVGGVELGNAWINIGNCLQRQLDWVGAENAYQLAVEIYRSEEEIGCRVEIARALSGALRNYGTCCWKQRRIVEAIDQFTEGILVEEEIVSRLSGGSVVGADEDICQAKLSMAQMLGILGCLYLEPSTTEAPPSFFKSKSSFQKAIEIYLELGYTADHPSVIWAGTNLKSVNVLEDKQAKAPPPPPPPTPPPKKRNPLSPSSMERPEIVNRGVSDQAAFGINPPRNGRETSDKGEGDSVFLGVEDYQSSTDELDEILSERVETITKSAKEIKLLDEKNLSHDSPFDGETCNHCILRFLYS